jgi:hypothetical protein
MASFPSLTSGGHAPPNSPDLPTAEPLNRHACPHIRPFLQCDMPGSDPHAMDVTVMHGTHAARDLSHIELSTYPIHETHAAVRCQPVERTTMVDRCNAGLRACVPHTQTRQTVVWDSRIVGARHGRCQSMPTSRPATAPASPITALYGGRIDIGRMERPVAGTETGSSKEANGARPKSVAPRLCQSSGLGSVTSDRASSS